MASPASPAPSIPVALTIAGSDSGGGAGIQADLKTFHAFGVFGASAITAVTVQNTLGVQGFHAVPVEVVTGQISAVAEDLHPTAVKTGMLATAELVHAVAGAIRAHRLPNYVMDPVMVATSGDRLLDEDAESSLARELLPLATVVTPNLPEASILAGMEVEDLATARKAARVLVEGGAGAALIKGGHGDHGEVVDLYWDGERELTWQRARMATTDTHGTGCTLSAGLAAALAQGLSLTEAVDHAIDFVVRAMETAPGLGGGHGPVNHFAGTAFLSGRDAP